MPARLNAGRQRAHRFLNTLFADGATQYTIEVQNETGSVDSYGDPTYNAPTTFTLPMVADLREQPDNLISDTGQETEVDVIFHVALIDWEPVRTAIVAGVADPDIVTPEGRRLRLLGTGVTPGQNGIVTLYAQKYRDSA